MIARRLEFGSSIIILATRRPIRPNPLMPNAYPIDKDEDLGATLPTGLKATTSRFSAALKKISAGSYTIPTAVAMRASRTMNFIAKNIYL